MAPLKRQRKSDKSEAAVVVAEVNELNKNSDSTNGNPSKRSRKSWKVESPLVVAEIKDNNADSIGNPPKRARRSKKAEAPPQPVVAEVKDNNADSTGNPPKRARKSKKAEAPPQPVVAEVKDNNADSTGNPPKKARKSEKSEAPVVVAEAKNNDTCSGSNGNPPKRSRKSEKTEAPPAAAEVKDNDTGSNENPPKRARKSEKSEPAPAEVKDGTNSDQNGNPPKRGRKSNKSVEAPIPVVEEVKDNSTDSNGNPPKKVKKSAANEPTFKESEQVYCHFSNQLYKAIIKEVRPASNLKVVETGDVTVGGEEQGDGKAQKLLVRSLRSYTGRKRGFADDFAYFVHYSNWASKWDEWVRVDCLKPVTDETTKECMELKQLASKNRRQQLGQKKGRKRKSLKQKKAGERKSIDVSQLESSSQTEGDYHQSSNDSEANDLDDHGEVFCNAEESGYEGDLDSSILDPRLSLSDPAIPESLVKATSEIDSQQEDQVRESDCETEPENNLDDLDFLDLSPNNSLDGDDEPSAIDEVIQKSDLSEVKLDTPKQETENASLENVQKTELNVTEEAKTSTRDAIQTEDEIKAALDRENVNTTCLETVQNENDGVRLEAEQNEKNNAASEEESKLDNEDVTFALAKTSDHDTTTVEAKLDDSAAIPCEAELRDDDAALAKAHKIEYTTHVDAYQNGRVDISVESDKTELGETELSLNVAVPIVETEHGVGKYPETPMEVDESERLTTSMEIERNEDVTAEVVAEQNGNLTALMGTEQNSNATAQFDAEQNIAPKQCSNEESSGQTMIEICWSKVESPCAIIASPTVSDIILDLTEYLKSETPGKLGEFFIEKLLATYESFCQSLPATEREASEKAMSAENVDRFSEVVHCGGVARLIQIMESKVLYRRVEEVETQHKNPSDAIEADLVDDMRIILEVCKDYFQATKRYFEEKYDFRFSLLLPDMQNNDFESSETTRLVP